MKTRYKIGLTVVALLACAFYVFQLPHGGTINALTADDGDDIPLTTEGYIDYLEITNRQLRKNVTVDNNVVVDFVQIFGTDNHLPEEIKNDFLELLGDPEFSNENSYRDVHGWAHEHLDATEMDAFNEDVNECYSSPWNESNHPLIADWLAQHQRHLDQMVEASRKPYYYHPLCEKDGVVVGALLPYAQNSRETGRGLSLRAMHELEKGNLKACLRDLTAIRRIGRLMDQGSTLVENLVGYAITGIAFECEKAVLQSLANGAELSEQEISAYRKVIRETCDRDLLGGTMRRGEGTFMRDIIQRLERGNTDYMEMLGVPEHSWAAPTAATLLSPITDWEVVAKKCAEHSERLATVLDTKNDILRRGKLEELEAEIQANAERRTRVGSTMFRLVVGAKSRGDLTADVLLGMLTPATIQIDDARLRVTGYELADLGFAIELYRRKHGEFPKTLDQLVPEFIDAIPVDRFTGGPLNYRVAADGYRVWNVGRNRADEQLDEQDNLRDLEVVEDASPRHLEDDTLIDVRTKGDLSK